jgi:hypothetical protein
MDDKFLQEVLKYMFEEKAIMGAISSMSGHKPQHQQQPPPKKEVKV